MVGREGEVYEGVDGLLDCRNVDQSYENTVEL